MSLFRRASQVKKKFKVCMYGSTGTGKTISALTFPKPAYIDMEGGVDWYIDRKIIPEQNDDFDLLQTDSAREVINAIDELKERIRKEPGCVETIVIDPITVFWDALQDAFLNKLRKKKGADAELKFNHWKAIKAPYKNALTTLVNLPTHLVVIGREGYEYEMKGKELVQVGVKIQTEKDTPYISDTYVRMTKNKGKFFATVEKDRTNMMKEGTVVEGFTFQHLMKLAHEHGIADMVTGQQEVKEAPDTSEDEKIFDEPRKDYDELLNDEAIKKLWMELDWAPGKVKAIIEKEKLFQREDLGKYLADKVRSKRGQ